MSGANTTSAASGSRSRQPARRKPNDDAGYFGPSGGSSAVGTKRHAVDKADGEPRVKRKRVEPGGTSGVGANATGSRKDADVDGKASLVDFTTMPITVLHRYMTTFDLIPTITPSPLSTDDPPPPYTLEQPFRHSSRPPSPPPQSTPANRPQRNSGPSSRDVHLQHQQRRRSLRLVDDYQPRVPVLADVEDLKVVLASVVERHFREVIVVSGREEVDTLAAFMCAVEKAKGGRSR